MDTRESLQLGADPDKRKRRAIIFGLAGLVLLIVGMMVGRGIAPEQDKSSEDIVPFSAERPGPSAMLNGVPVGYARNEDGAVAAATNFSRVMANVAEDPDVYHRAVQTLAAPAWRAEAEKLANTGLQFFAERYGPEGSLSFVPVRYRVSDYSNSGGIVEIWGVSIASSPRIAGIEESWITGTIRLVWVEGDWRVAGQQSETGPTPELLGTDDQRGADVLNEFAEYQHAPAL